MPPKKKVSTRSRRNVDREPKADHPSTTLSGQSGPQPSDETIEPHPPPPPPTLKDFALGCLPFLPLAGASPLLVTVAMSLPLDRRMAALIKIGESIATQAGALPLPATVKAATYQDWQKIHTGMYHAHKYAEHSVMADLHLFMDYAVQGMEPAKILDLMA